MNQANERSVDLREIARQAMIEQGLEPEFPADARQQAATITHAAVDDDQRIRDLRELLWCSIDNDDSLDLDQLSVGERLTDGSVKTLIAIADVDAVVTPGSPIDLHARANTTSVYTAARIFPMLPEKLSTNLTSLNEHEDRLAIVIEMVVDSEGTVRQSEVYRALVRNQAKLTYNAVAAWLTGSGPIPEKVAASPGLAEQLRLQDEAAQSMRRVRYRHGALNFETIEPRAIVRDGVPVDLEQMQQNRAQELIEDLMVGANGVAAQFLSRHGFPSLRRVVRSPERWDKIVAVAAQTGDQLPQNPDSQSLAQFLTRRREADPLRFPDLSLTIIKLLGSGEYVLELPNQDGTGHFGLAVRDYTHSTAPNRRYPDLITQRLIKAVLRGEPNPYDNSELTSLAAHCTQQEDGANKVERKVRKSAAAMLLSNRIGETFDGIVTGAAATGTWTRVFRPPVEGRVVRGFQGLDVGDRVRVRLLGVDIQRGFIDFARA